MPVVTTDRDDVRAAERLVELAVFGPLELTAKVVEEIPTALDKARQQLVLARFIGKMAVDQGVQELRRRLDSEGLPSEEDPAPEEPSDRPLADEETSDGEVPHPDELALPDYEQLPAAHVVAKLAGLTQDERDAIERFELANRHRRTVLGKIDQLRVS